MAKYSLKTLPVEMSSKQFCLDFLITALNVLPLQPLIRDLAYIGKTLDQVSIMTERHDELVAKYATIAMKEDLAKDSEKSVVFLLFNRFSLRLIDELLRKKNYRSNAIDAYNNVDEVPFSVVAINERLLSLEGLFLLANTLLVTIEGESCFSEVDTSEQTKIFYSRVSYDKAVAIGRSRMYRYRDFPLRLKSLGIVIEDYLKTIFSLCAHVESYPLIEIDLPGSLGQMNANAKEILLKYLPQISSVVKSSDWDLTTPDSLLKLYCTSALCRQHPLIEVESRYYCLQPGLLWSVLADLPFYLLLDSFKRDKKKVHALWQAWGEVFEEHWRSLGQRVFGEDKCRDYLCHSKHPEMRIKQKEHRIGDLFVTPDENTRVIFEFKGAAPDDTAKLGSKSSVNLKFIQKDNDKGIPQLVRDVSLYRQEMSFNGVIFIVFVCRGPIPLTSDFDTSVENYLQKCNVYQEYLKNSQNRPVIWLDALLAESLFSGIRQGLPAEEVLQSLSGALPSQVLGIIGEKIQQQGLKLSRAPLYSEEIELRAEQFRSMFSSLSENPHSH